jgi:hypothetical protein
MTAWKPVGRSEPRVPEGTWLLRFNTGGYDAVIVCKVTPDPDPQRARLGRMIYWIGGGGSGAWDYSFTRLGELTHYADPALFDVAMAEVSL